jgi:glycosyltransferase involved in cell wall biosynthesis
MELSIILCTYNRSNVLIRTLKSLQSQELPENFAWEVVVVDNNSTDDTPQRIREFAENSKLPIRYLKEEKQGLSHARNKGVTEARGRYVHFSEDDEIADKHLIREIYGTFESYKCDCVGGRIYLKLEDEMPRWLTRDIWGFLGYLDYGDNAIQMDEQRYPFGGNMAFSKEVFNKIGLFNVDLGRKGNELFGGEEVDLFRRLLSAGGKGVYQPKALVYHIVNQSRLQKTYFRTLHYKEGMQRALFDGRVYQRSLRGIPLFIFPQFLGSIRNYISAIFSHGRNNSFRKEMNICWFIGYMRGKVNKYKESRAR